MPYHLATSPSDPGEAGGPADRGDRIHFAGGPAVEGMCRRAARAGTEFEVLAAEAEDLELPHVAVRRQACPSRSDEGSRQSHPEAALTRRRDARRQPRGPSAEGMVDIRLR